jgi:YD repeat-containing protein
VPIVAVVGLPRSVRIPGFNGDGGGGGSSFHSPNSKGSDNKDKKTPPNPTQPSDCSGDSGGNPESGHPVIVQTGEKHSTEQDFRSLGLYGLSLQREYRSSIPVGRLFGAGWSSDYDTRLTSSGCYHDPENATVCFPTVVNIAFPNGAVFEYDLNTHDQNYYALGAERMGILSWNGPGTTERWTLITASGSYVFDAYGNPIRTILPNGALHAKYIYTSGLLTSVSNNAGQLISIGWLSGKVNTITDPAGKIWKYSFNSTGMLASVTSPNGHVRSYGYDPTNTRLLTNITVDGVQTLAVTYDPATGKVKKSGTPDSEYFESFVYGAGTTAVTNQAGDVQTFTFGPYGATAISHGATVSCAAAAESTSYDANGYVDFSLDYNGNKTDYTYGSSGLLMDVTVAAGTALAQKTSIEWMSSYLAGQQKSKVHYFGTDGVEFMTATYAYFPSGAAGGRLQSEVMKDLKTGVSRETDYTYS